MPDNPETSRRIRSYVRREGRMTEAQRHAIAKHWNTYGIDYSPDEIDLDGLYQRGAPRVLEIGAGTGDTTLRMAREHPENDYLAVEVHRPGIGSLLRKIAKAQLNNIRISNHDVIEVLQYQIPPDSLDLIYIFFPDPWPKKRHYKRRLINSTFLDLVKKRLKSHGRLFIATDWQDYAEHILLCFGDNHGFVNLAGSGRFAPRPRWRDLTRFEKRGQRLLHQVRDFIYART